MQLGVALMMAIDDECLILPNRTAAVKSPEFRFPWDRRNILSRVNHSSFNSLFRTGKPVTLRTPRTRSELFAEANDVNNSQI
jgi:hypothetical protein